MKTHLLDQNFLPPNSPPQSLSIPLPPLPLPWSRRPPVLFDLHSLPRRRLQQNRLGGEGGGGGGGGGGEDGGLCGSISGGGTVVISEDKWLVDAAGDIRDLGQIGGNAGGTWKRGEEGTGGTGDGLVAPVARSVLVSLVRTGFGGGFGPFSFLGLLGRVDCVAWDQGSPFQPPSPPSEVCPITSY